MSATTTVESTATAAMEAADCAATRRATADESARITERATVSVDPYTPAAVISAAVAVIPSPVSAAIIAGSIITTISVISAVAVGAASISTG